MSAAPRLSSRRWTIRREAVRDKVREIILGALDVDYMSESCQDAIKTGNHYQSLDLGDSTTQGFRTARADFLDRVDFRDKKVLDLGSNLGEMSRGARARGARLVDGFEYDPYFVELADLVNVHNGVTRVSFYRRDITDPSIYGERYDIVLVLSVFIYARRVVDRLAEITDVLVLETHKLHGNLQETYLDPITRYFPHYTILGETEWGTIHDPGETRAVLVFAKTEELLRSTLVEVPARNADAPAHAGTARHETFSTDIDIRRTQPHEPFFERFPALTGADVLAAVAEHELDLDALLEGPDAGRRYRSWTYWFLMLRGYFEYRERGTVDPGNAYLRYLRRWFGPDGPDPSFARVLLDEEAAVTAVTRRFRDLAHYEGSDGTSASGYAPASIRLVLSDPPRRNPPSLYTSSGELLQPRQLDGWHRLFAARLFGVERVPAEVVRADARAGELLAVLEHVSYDGARVELTGWCLSSDGALTQAQLTADGRWVANVELQRRDDVAARFPHLPQAGLCGFHFEGETWSERGTRIDFAVTAMHDWLPAGRIEMTYPTATMGDRRRPPTALARRLTGHDDPTAVAARATRSTAVMLARLGEHLDLESAGRVLEWGVDTGLLQPALSVELEGAAITGVGFDREAVDWARRELPGDFVLAGRAAALDLPAERFEAVIGCSALSHLRPDEQRPWLEELHRLTRAGGYLVLSVGGELIRRFLPAERSSRLERDGIVEWSESSAAGRQLTGRTVQSREYTVSLCSERFEVVEYLEGIVHDAEDLVLLKKT